jgi:uncharacterized protein YceK
MKGITVPAIATVVLSGCTGAVWKATGSKDKFTDQSTTMVTAGDYSARTSTLQAKQ